MLLVSVLLNQYTDNLHERSERVRLVFSDYIDQAVKQCNKPLILGFRMGDTDLPICLGRFCVGYSFHWPSSYSVWVNTARM